MTIITAICIIILIAIINIIVWIPIIMKSYGKIELQDSIQPQSDMCIECGHIDCTCSDHLP